MSASKFEPEPLQCRKCKDIIWSRYEGEFVSCKCRAISVDQTRYYSRYIGNPENFIEVTTNHDSVLPNI